MESYLLVRNLDEADELMNRVRTSAVKAHNWIAEQTGDPLDILRRMKFDTIGYHPIEHHPLNIVEQINQTWTFAVAISAVKQLLLLHTKVGGYRLAPGAHASLELDIMSVEVGEVGAETFAAVHPRNNNKLAADLSKLANRPERHRYVFFLSPKFPGNKRLLDLNETVSKFGLSIFDGR